MSGFQTAPTNPVIEGDFPNYKDSDVLIVLSQTRQYRLHSHILRLHSDFFKEALTEDRAAQLSSRARKEGKAVRYRLDLELDERDGTGIGSFKSRVSLPPTVFPPSQQPTRPSMIVAAPSMPTQQPTSKTPKSPTQPTHITTTFSAPTTTNPPTSPKTQT